MDRRTGKKQKSIKPPEFDKGYLGIVLASAKMPKPDYPVFCFKHLVSGYNLDGCDKDQKAYFVAKLAMMAQQTWDDLMLAGHKSGAGFETISKVALNVQLPPIITEDVEKVYVMRFKEKYRMIGHRSDYIYHITHIDINLSAYDHGN